MKKVWSTALLLFLSLCSLWAQNNTQTVKGIIVDKLSQSPVEGAAAVLLGGETPLGATSDQEGKYVIPSVPPGRYELKVSYLGYKDVTIPNVMVSSGKETVLDIQLEDNLHTLQGAEVKAGHKHTTLNELTTVSARTFSTEEVNRYAGGRSDPARLAANFAGVSAPDDSRNDIVIRGNSPTGVLWRIEGMNIGNPNHFSTVGTTGGPVSALNTNMLKNSDFFTSAFPAEYGNATAGVFDLGFRKGNADKREHTLQFGMLTGLELMTEGPINKAKGSSYLLAYRYSFTGLAQAMGLSVGTTATPFYQDVAFKVQGGMSKAGRLTLFGMGGTSDIKFMHDEIDNDDLFADPTADSYFESRIGVIGLKHFIKAGKNSYFNTIMGATYASSEYNEDSLGATDGAPARVVENRTTRLNYNFITSFNSKISKRLFLKTGVQAEVLNLELFYRDRQLMPDWKQIWDYNDYTTLSQAYVHARYDLNSQVTFNVGVHAQWLALNGSFAVEPRAGVKYALSPRSTISFGYGLHSQMQPIDVYFYRDRMPDGSYDQSNRDLGFTQSHHLVLGYDWLPAKDWRVKAELYYQLLGNLPVTRDPSSFSMLNNGADFNPNDQGFLINKGTGYNYGAELTVEKFFSKGYYGLLTATLYRSRYEGSDGIERNTAFNGTYVFNILGGKEFKVGREKKNAITTDLKMTMAGGRYYTPVDLEASRLAREQVLMGDDYAFTQQNPDYFRIDFKAGYTLNSRRRRVSHSLFFDIQNVTNYKNVFASRYNTVTQSVNTAYQIGLFPNFVYKVQF